MFAFALLLLLPKLSVAEEPTCTCSKFHYEEQMLEKMVRMEFSVERIKHNMIEAKETMEKTLGEFRTLKDENEKLSVANAASKEAMKKDLEEFKKLKVEYEKSVENSSNELTKLKDSLVTPRIAFKAKKVRNQSPQINDVIVFTETVFNYGEHYNNVTGVFSAPVGGTYLFTIQLCLQTQKYLYYGIMIENERVTNGMFYERNTVNCNTADGIVVLKPGNRVWVQYLRSSSTGSTIEGNNDHRWNTFSGTLLHL